MDGSLHDKLPANRERHIAMVVELIPHNARLGVRMVEIAFGSCTTCVEFRPDLVGDPSRGVLHGGVVTTLIDTAAGGAVYSTVEMGTPVATLDMRIDYLRPTEPDKRLYASAELYRLTRRNRLRPGIRLSGRSEEPGRIRHCFVHAARSGIPDSERVMTEPPADSNGRESLPSLNRALPYAGFMNLDVVVEDGRPITILRRSRGNVGNPLVPMIHGGAVGALLEHAALMQVFFELNLRLNDRPKIVNISIDYLRPCLLEDTYASGVIVRQGRRVANVRVDAWQSDPTKLVAAGHAHFLLPGNRTPG